jgi:hypothetical protein
MFNAKKKNAPGTATDTPPPRNVVRHSLSE